MNQLPAPTIKKLQKLLPMLSSDHDGEVVAAAQAINRTLKATGHSLHELSAQLAQTPKECVVEKIVEKVVYRDVVVVEEKIVYRDPPGPPPAFDAELLDIGEVIACTMWLQEAPLSAREREFVDNVQARAAAEDAVILLSSKQAKWFRDLRRRHGSFGPEGCP